MSVDVILSKAENSSETVINKSPNDQYSDNTVGKIYRTLEQQKGVWDFEIYKNKTSHKWSNIC